ncbi:MAG: DNA repair protein RadC [Gemmatimonadales bacterium]|nr:DNA repair protein RadC [Gemmatimonadales bacterium]
MFKSKDDSHVVATPSRDPGAPGTRNQVGRGVAPGGDPDRSSRFLRFGAEALSELELLSWVLGPGGVIKSDEAARRLLERYGSLANLAKARPGALRKGLGLGPVRTGRLLAALELGLRASTPVARTGIVVNRPEDLHELLYQEFRGLDRERFVALYLDTRHRLQEMETVSVGSLNASLVHPREVFKQAVIVSAAALIVAHNHPSGCARPSGDDLDLTCRLDRCGELLGISLLDHLVVGEQEIISIREYGWPVSREGC